MGGMAPEPQSRTSGMALIAVFALSGLAALAVLMRAGGGRAAPAAAPAAKTTRAWPEERGPEVGDPSMIRTDENRSGLDMVEKPPEAAAGGSSELAGYGASGGASAETAAAEAKRAAAKAAPPGPPPGGDQKLSASEEERLKNAAGDLSDPRRAKSVGAEDGLWTRAVTALAGSPKVLGFLLNNDLVVKAFMERPTSQRYCSSPSAYTSYLSNTKAPGGVTHAMDVFERVLHADPKTPGVMFASKLGGAIMDCPSVKAIVKDEGAIHQIALANPRAVQMMLDPALMMGLASNPTAMDAFQGVQGSLTRK